MSDQPTPPASGANVATRSFWISMLNVALAILTVWLLFGRLDDIRHNRTFGAEEVVIVRDTIQTGTPDSPAIQIKEKKIIKKAAPDTNKAAVQPMIIEEKKILTPAKRPVDFYDIILLMLISGAIGGVLSNLRGIYVFYRDESELPAEMHVPYLTRPFTGAICGLLVYFVASLLVTSITVEAVSEGIGFQGMISYMAMAIVAGFGSQEFMERLKALSETLFGEKKELTDYQKLTRWKRMMDKGLISAEQYNTKVADMIGGKPLEDPGAGGFEKLVMPPPDQQK